MISRTRWLACAAAVALAGCGPITRISPSALRADDHAVARGHAIVVDGTDLEARGADLLAVLRNRVAGMQVDRSGVCPRVVLRNQKSIFGDNSPLVYVDGTRTVDACVLDMLQPSDVARVEVYLQGITPRTGYEGNPNGLILIFMRTAGS